MAECKPPVSSFECRSRYVALATHFIFNIKINGLRIKQWVLGAFGAIWPRKMGFVGCDVQEICGLWRSDAPQPFYSGEF
jgi:hypothetical protein